MQKATFALALVSFMLALWAVLRPNFSASASSPQRMLPASLGIEATRPSERIYPPLILVGNAWVECVAPTTQGGRLAIHMVSGQGFDFNTALLSIKNPRVKVQETGLIDEFNAFPSGGIITCLKGIGDGAISAMKIEVWFHLRRCKQLSQSVHFDMADSGSDPPYIELTGIFKRRIDGKRFPFRVVFSHLIAGGGDITTTAFNLSQNLTQTIRLGTPTKPATVMTSLYEMEDDVRVLTSN